MLGLFWRRIPVFSKTLKSKYSARANFMFSRNTCFLVPGWSAAEFSRALQSKYHLQLNFCEEWPERAAVTQHSWLSSGPARTPEEQGPACGDRCGILQPRPGSVTQLLELLRHSRSLMPRVQRHKAQGLDLAVSHKLFAACLKVGAMRDIWKMPQICHDLSKRIRSCSTSMSQSFMASKVQQD